MAASELVLLAREIVDEVWNRGKLDQADRLIVPDDVNDGGLIPDLVHGPEAVKLSVTMYRLAFPHLHNTVDDLVTDEESITFRWSAPNGPMAFSARPPARREATCSRE